MALHESDILLHQAAKKHFDSIGLTKLPTTALLRTQYAPVMEEIKIARRDYRQAKNEMRELLTAKSNIDRLLNITERRPEPEAKHDN